MPNSIVDVAVGVLLRPDGWVLLGNRPQGKPWAGWWELPGGKLEPGETVLAALTRELHEELGIEVKAATPWVTYVHEYPTTTVRLHFCKVTAWVGQAQSLEQQELKWVDPEAALQLTDLLPATYPPLRWLQIPTRYLISSAHDQDGLAAFMDRLQRGLDQGIRLVQWREPDWQANGDQAALRAAFHEVLTRCHAHRAKLMINSVHDQDLWSKADGVHFRVADAGQLQRRPDELADKWAAVSTHDEHELALARAFGADFVVLGPVLPTQSHPGSATLGWQAFEQLNQSAGLPVFAIGGQTGQMLEQAQSRGAHGIAGMRELIS